MGLLGWSLSEVFGSEQTARVGHLALHSWPRSARITDGANRRSPIDRVSYGVTARVVAQAEIESG
jgi:hypothetical protein